YARRPELRFLSPEAGVRGRSPPPRVLAANDEREGVFELEVRSPDRVPPLAVLALDFPANRRRIADRLLCEDRRVRRPGVLGVDVQVSRRQRLVADEGAAEVELPVHSNALPLERLRHDLAQEDLLRKVLRADAHGRA